MEEILPLIIWAVLIIFFLVFFAFIFKEIDTEEKIKIEKWEKYNFLIWNEVVTGRVLKIKDWKCLMEYGHVSWWVYTCWVKKSKILYKK